MTTPKLQETEPDIATALADMIDERGAWDHSDDPEHGPNDRFTIVHVVLYRGVEPDRAWVAASLEDAKAKFRAENKRG